ncbi:MAG: IscS subfamily cysteine desulfurase [Deltaproteobacteria bacterium]|nr:IscS subfamily cysteine desulfurase [Deltaproteobacteria bacterium]
MSVQLPIYLDNHATTRIDPRALEAMMPYLTDVFGNAGSRNHSFGWKAQEGVERAREQVASLIGADAKEIVFTSGATESDNLALFGVARFYKDKGRHIVTALTEHKAILDSCHALEKEGFEITYLPVEKDGSVSPEVVAAALRDDTILVSIMWANNEVGTVNDIAGIGKVCRERGVFFHSDAVQGIGKMPFDVAAMNVDLVSISAHKMYGPKGIGALYVRRGRPRIRLEPLIFGGGQERGLRSGTAAVHQIVGLGAACALAQQGLAEGEADRIRALRDRLWDGLRANLDELYLNGSWERRLPGNLNVSFAFCEGEAMMMAIKDLAVSSGSACTSASLEPSYVLRAMGVDVELAHTSIRFGVGRFNTEAEIDYAVQLVTQKVGWLREMSPLYEMVKEGIDLKSIEWAAH